MRPHERADPTYYSDGENEFVLKWSKDDTTAVLSVLAGGSKARLTLTIEQLDLLREFLNANVE